MNNTVQSTSTLIHHQRPSRTPATDSSSIEENGLLSEIRNLNEDTGSQNKLLRNSTLENELCQKWSGKVKNVEYFEQSRDCEPVCTPEYEVSDNFSFAIT